MLFLVGNKTSPDESSRPSGKQVSGAVVRSDQPTFTREQEQKYCEDTKKDLIYQMKNMKHGSRSIILVTPQQVTLALSYSMLSYYMYVDDDGKSAGQVGASSDMQPMNSPLFFVKCETPMFSIVEEWEFARLRL